MAQRSPKEQANEILSKADEILAKVDAAEIFTIKAPRKFPVFRFDEIVSGSMLGVGGYSGVKEIEAFNLSDENAEEKKKKSQKGGNKRKSLPDDILKHIMGEKVDEPHYDVTTARSFMSENCVRFESSRYAIKKLKPELGPVDRARGAIDLAIEIKFLSVIWHPNISEFFLLFVV